jgi:hypothetical protein
MTAKMVHWSEKSQRQQAGSFFSQLCSSIGSCEEIPEYETIKLGGKADCQRLQLIVDLNSISPNIEVQHYDFDQITNDLSQHDEETFFDVSTKDINVNDMMDECVDNLMNYVSYASGCEPCGEFVNSKITMPRKGILKKTSPTMINRYPNRSSYYYSPDDEDEVDDCLTINRSVSFSSVDIKEFKMTLGHHPSVSSGPPLMLDGAPLASQVVDLDDFEASRSQTRRTTRRQLKLSRTDRNGILDEEGFTPEEINDACVQARKIRQQREESLRTGVLLSAIEDLLETVSSKYSMSEIGQCF